MRPIIFLVCLFFSALLLADCQSPRQEAGTQEQAQQHRKKHRRRPHNQDFHQQDSISSGAGYQHDTHQYQRKGAQVDNNQIPKKVYNVLAYVRANGRAIDGYVGGRRFGNFEHHLPRSSPDGKPINYQEWDVNPKVSGQNRGIERLITGADGRSWYTDDHYNTFREVK